MATPSSNSNHNRHGHSTASLDVSIDVAQWRQDVDAFAAATRQMLDSVHEELSNGLASGKAEVTLKTEHSTKPSSTIAASTPRANLSRVPKPATEIENDCDQLLAQLKKQLSQQLNQ